MKLGNIKQISLLTLSIVVILIGINFVTNKDSEVTTKIEGTQTSSVKTNDISLSIDGLYTSKKISVAENVTILAILEELNETDPDLKLDTKSYGELGTLIVSMGGKTNGEDDNYWQYEVNGVQPMIGADRYELSMDDNVVWQFKKSEF